MPNEELPSLPELPGVPAEQAEPTPAPSSPEAPKRSIAEDEPSPAPRPESKTAPPSSPEAPKRSVSSGEAPDDAEGKTKRERRERTKQEKSSLERDMEKKAAERGVAPEKKKWWQETVTIGPKPVPGPKEPLSFAQRLWRGIKGGALMYPVGIATNVALGISGYLPQILENVFFTGTTNIAWTQWLGASLAAPATLWVTGAGFAAGFLTRWFRRRREQKQ